MHYPYWGWGVARYVGAGPGTDEDGPLQRKAKTLRTDSKVFLRQWNKETRGGGGAWLVEGESKGGGVVRGQAQTLFGLVCWLVQTSHCTWHI